MKLVHLSDLHIGKRVNEVSMLEDQAFILSQILDIIDQQQPQAVLIRGVQGYNGPGKLTKALCIDRSFNGESLVDSSRIWLEDGESLPFKATPRIGIGYAAEKDQQALWRFVAE